jgi:aryl-alcohol dehydrogenase-like predicted oxidoreductase
VERVNAILTDLGLDSAEALPEVALRFCLSNPAVSSVIPGMRTQRSVQRNVAIPGKGPLPDSALKVLRRHTWDRNFYD